MADNSLQGGTDTIRDIDKAGVKTQVFALDLGGAGAESLLDGTNRMPAVMDELVYLLASILEKMPRVDANDRLVVNPSESTAPVTVSSGTITTVSNQTNVGGRDASHAAYALANIGALHIYNNIQVTA